MPREQGLRDRKKAQMREHLADVAARLFAERGYDDVSIIDVARAADVSDQTVYNYFSAKHELVLDRADEFVDRYRRAVGRRASGVTPASVLRPLVAEDIDRYSEADLSIARGEFPAQCLASPVLRRYALEFRERQTDEIAAAIVETDPGISVIVARSHAAGLISIVQAITDQIGSHILKGDVNDAAARQMSADAAEAFDHLDSAFQTMTKKDI